MEPVWAQPTMEEEEAEEAWQNAASVSSAIGPEDLEDTAAEESEMKNFGSQLKSVLTRVPSKRIAVLRDHEASPAPAKRLKRDDDRCHEDRNRCSDRGQDDSHQERHSHKLSSSSQSSKRSSAGFGSSRSRSFIESWAVHPAGVGSSGNQTTADEGPAGVGSSWRGTTVDRSPAGVGSFPEPDYHGRGYRRPSSWSRFLRGPDYRRQTLWTRFLQEP